MPELSRRLKWQRRMDDYGEVVGDSIMYVAFIAFLLGLVWAVATDSSLRWAWWLLVPAVIGAVLSSAFGSPWEPEEKSTSRRWRR